MAKHFLHFDEIEDVLSSLDLLALTVPLVKKQPSYWKWVLVASQAFKARWYAPCATQQAFRF
jgi:hypothetical protein